MNHKPQSLRDAIRLLGGPSRVARELKTTYRKVQAIAGRGMTLDDTFRIGLARLAAKESVASKMAGREIEAKRLAHINAATISAWSAARAGAGPVERRPGEGTMGAPRRRPLVIRPENAA